jgi:pyruvate-formate lyase-activating enzyme
MAHPSHEEAEILDLMAAPLGRQAAIMADWGMDPAGLLILMSPCQARCFFCAQPAVTHPPPEDWTPWSRVEELLEANTGLGLKRLCLGGTEPSTHPDFHASLQLASEKGFSEVQLMTSALGLAEPGIAEEWRALGIRSLAVPIYSTDAAEHDAVCGLPCHDRLLRALDSAVCAGITVHLHTLALRQTLHALPELADLTRERWDSRLAIAPARPKPGVFDYGAATPGFIELEAVLGGISTEAASLVGFPLCIDPDRERGAAQVIDLYFKSQARSFAPPCEPCTLKIRCPGVVQGHLDHHGSGDLSPVRR